MILNTIMEEKEKKEIVEAQKERYVLPTAALLEIHAGSDSAKTNLLIESQLKNFKLKNNGSAF